MRLNRWLPSLLAVGVASVAYSQTTTLDWEARYKELCKYDNLCSSLKNGDGTWREPKKEVLEAIKALKETFIKYSARFGVDPVAVAGSIMSENSLNVTISDGIQDFLVKMKIAENGKLPILGKSFSFGWGQLYMEAATEAEVFAANVEKRSLRSSQTVSEMLVTPDGAVYYAAALTAKIVSDYKNEGFDISSNPGVITSLYNLGGSAGRAKQTKINHTEPRVNYFGFFVDKNVDKLRKIFTQESKTNASTAQSQKTEVQKLGASSRFAQVVYQDLPLYAGYTTCSLEGNYSKQMNDYYKYTSMKLPRQVATLKQNEEWVVLSESIDCDLEPWLLIKSESGQTGWIKESHLKASTIKFATNKIGCKNTKRSSCETQTAQQNQKYLLSNDSGRMQFRLSGPKNKVDVRYANIGCENSSLSVNSMYKPIPPPTMGELKKVIDALGVKRMEAAKLAKFDEYPIGMSQKLGLYSSFSSIFDYSYDTMVKSYDPGLPENTPSNIVFYHNNSSIKYQQALSVINKIIVKEDWSMSEFIQMTSEVGNFSAYTYITSMSSSSSKSGSFSPAAETQKVIALKNESLKKLQSCDWMSKDWKKTTQIMNTVRDKIKAATTINDPIFLSIEQQIVPACNNFNAVFFPKPNSYGSSTCNVNIKFSGGGNAMPNLSHDMIRKMAKTEEDKDVLMSAQLDPYNTLVPTVSSAQLRATGAVLPGSSQKYQQPDQDLQCSYDPIATLKVVEAMLKNPCVQSIQIPDPFIINKLNSSKVIYRPFVDNDRFVVDTGFIECGGG